MARKAPSRRQAERARETEEPASGEVPDFYSLPLLYDVLHAPGTFKDVVGLEKIARKFSCARAGRPGAVWLEPACGTARHLRLAAKRGYRVVGIDLSEPMLAYGRERFEALGLSRRARMLRADIVHLDRLLPARSVDFAFNLINSIRHLKSEKACTDHLRAVASVLKPTGVYAVGISLSSYGNERPTEDVWAGARGNIRVTQAVQYIPAFAKKGTSGRFEQVISHLTVARPRGEEHTTLTYSLLSYDAEQWYGTIERAGMRVVATTTEQGREIPPAEPGYNVFILAPAERGTGRGARGGSSQA
jgi:ubiquinone/menaquinone biosynthesis C-methylase UbiE